jgi:hypothetical protein
MKNLILTTALLLSTQAFGKTYTVPGFCPWEIAFTEDVLYVQFQEPCRGVELMKFAKTESESYLWTMKGINGNIIKSNELFFINAFHILSKSTDYTKTPSVTSEFILTLQQTCEKNK